MSSNTPNLGLLKKDPMTDGNETFNIQTMLNDNWDKIDDKVGQMSDEIGNITVPDASLTVAGKTMLSNSITGTRENVAATEKAVKLALDKSLSSVPDASLTVAGKTMLSNAINGTRQNVAATEYAVKTAMENVKVENYDGRTEEVFYYVPSQYPNVNEALKAIKKVNAGPRTVQIDAGFDDPWTGQYGIIGFIGGTISITGASSTNKSKIGSAGYGIYVSNTTAPIFIRNIIFNHKDSMVNCQSPCAISISGCQKTASNAGDWLWFGGGARATVSNCQCSNAVYGDVIQAMTNSQVYILLLTGSNNFGFINASDGAIVTDVSGDGISATYKYSINRAIILTSSGPVYS
ncbi:tail fiber protein [Paenibacillus sp. VMFN-D1]|uniref:tail fiber protein n=1 Tax=Paenibacillus sp. VMFN-D1 TaxID=2135608 RepID=UPI000E276B19|nr:tail fiber protein [Paenibacillus sp. VMFN-D1]RED36353.1 tail fiber-like repeat protein [Paenibacillus sp. VMFN-D1]